MSTNRQADLGFGLPVQRRAVREYAREHRLRLVDLVADEGQSGSNGLETREGLAQAIERLEAGEAELLLVPRLDRLSRDLILTETIIERLRAAGHSVVSVAEPDLDSDDPTKVLIRQVLAAIAQWDRSNIARRMAAGRKAKRDAGGYAAGRPPFGMRVDRNRRELVPDKHEQATIVRMRGLRGDGQSYREICATLDAEGRATKGGQPWSPSTVRKVLNDVAK